MVLYKERTPYLKIIFYNEIMNIKYVCTLHIHMNYTMHYYFISFLSKFDYNP